MAAPKVHTRLCYHAASQFRDANTGAGQGITDLTAAVQLRLRVALNFVHLRVLRFAKLIAVRREGRERIQCLNPKPLAKVEAWLSLASCARKLSRFECAAIAASMSCGC